MFGRLLGYKHLNLVGSGGTRQTFKFVNHADKFHGNRETAIIIKEFIKVAPDDPDVWYMAGYLSNSAASKRQAYEKVLRIDPSHPKARAALAKLD